jgi:hypothetical protein
VGEGFAERHLSAKAAEECQVDCGPSSAAQQDQGKARTAATIANVGFIAGGVLVASGIVLMALPRPQRAPSKQPSGKTARSPVPIAAPILGRNLVGFAVRASF